MKEYDLIVIGSGAGAIIIENALAHDLSVALVEKGPLGGTCLNVGCIPSKMLIYPADRIAEIQEAKKLGVTAEIRHIDFGSIMERMRTTVGGSEARMRRAIQHSGDLDFYEGEGHFVKDHTLEVRGDKLKGRKIVIASGARPFIPALKGIEAADFLTNETVLQLTQKPESIIIVGGGFIAAEYAHFFASVGSKVVLLQKGKRLIPDEEPEISLLLKKTLSRRIEVHTETEATTILKNAAGYVVRARDLSSGKESDFYAEKIMIAAGRMSNADLLTVQNTGVETDSRNYIRVNEFFETSRENIWAFGDAIGKKMFRHVANREASAVWHNVVHGAKERVNYQFAPHAVFSHPEIASVGLTESEARKLFGKNDVVVGKARYSDVARGEAMREDEAFAKAVVKKETGKILGFHIIGPYASILIQEVVTIMANDLDMWAIGKGMHIHPALPELIIAALGNLQGE